MEQQFVGNQRNRIDRKGRVSVPAAYRAILDARGVRQLYLCKHPTTPHTLLAVAPDYFARLDAEIGQYALHDKRADTLRRFKASFQAHQFDPEGRIALEPGLAAHAGVTEEVVFAGCGEWLEVWNPAGWAAAQAESEAAIGALWGGGA